MNSPFRQWSDVRAFLAVMREGSTLAASRTLGMAQPTVARRIDALEHHLGLTLFHRDTRGFKPTVEAIQLQPLAEAIETAAAAFGDTAKTLAHPRPIRITAFAANLEGRATEIFAAFSDQHPEIVFEFEKRIRVYDLLAGEADIALRLAWTPPEPDLISRHISEAAFTMYASPEYAAAHGLPATPEDMANHKVLSFQRADVMPTIYNWLRRYVADANIIRRFSESALMDAAILSGQGIGLVNCRLAEPDVKAGRLIKCFEAPQELTVPHLLLISPDAWQRPEVKTFVAFFAPRYAKIYR
ncbi:MAG: LysR family transcriptional regulator [Pseudomonadota bacterium]